MKKPRIYERIKRALESRRRDSLFRRVAAPALPCRIDCATNSYLALEHNAAVAAEAARLCGGALAGNLASRLIATRSPLYETLERELASWKECPAALVFNSGYAANLGVLQALAGRDTAVFSDRLNHASIIDGIRLSGAKMVRYAHGNIDDLARRLKASAARETLIVTDTVFSMDGDVAPLASICELARRRGAMVMVDEAHATGVLGPHAAGLVDALGLHDAVDIRMGTLSKAVAGLGSFVAGSAMLRDFLVNSARSLIYSTALPHAALAFDLAATRHIRAHPAAGATAIALARRLRQGLTDRGFDTLGSSTQIVPCVTGDEHSAGSLAAFLRERAINAPAIRPPTVPRGAARIRFSIHAGLDTRDIDEILDAVDAWRRRR
jgi:8-amino-7-oxononanoate synthase